MPRPDYTQAVLWAREKSGRISHRVARKMDDALNQYIALITHRVQQDPGSGVIRANLGRVRTFDEARSKLLNAMTSAVNDGRELTYLEVQDIWAKASDQAILKNLPTALKDDADAIALGVGVNAPAGTILGVFESLSPVGSWRTLLPQVVKQGTEDIEYLMEMALLDGASPSKIQYSLRKYVLGRENVQEAFGWMGPRTKFEQVAAKNSLKYNARRIAYSEVHNARAEAEILHFAADPNIKAVRWSLSPFRGPYAQTDECDMLAQVDWYGLGPGIFPVDKVPFPPHPFDRCERKPVYRPLSERDLPKPTGTIQPRTPDFIPKEFFKDRNGNPLTKAQREKIIQRTRGVLDLSANKLAAAGLREVADQSTSRVISALAADLAARKVAVVDADLLQMEDLDDYFNAAKERAWKRELDLEDKARQALDERDQLQAQLKRVQDENFDLQSKIIEKRKAYKAAHPDWADAGLADYEFWVQENVAHLEEELDQLRAKTAALAEAREAAQIKASSLRAKVNRALVDELIPSVDEVPKATVPAKIRIRKKPFKEMTASATEELEKVIPKRWEVKRATDFRLTADLRSYHNRGEIFMARIHDEKRFLETLFHEYGHNLEYAHDELREAAIKFLKHRTDGEDAVKLQKLFPTHKYKAHEIAKEDNFIHAYMGKIYPGERASEILSMGLEYFMRDPERLYHNDPEYFLYVLRFLKGQNPWP